jgi:hypothetical protein
MHKASETPATRQVEPSDLERMIQEGRRASGLTLRGAVVRCWQRKNGRLRMVVRDTDYASTATVEVDVPMPVVECLARGTQIHVFGELKREWMPRLQQREVWIGSSLRIGSKASGLVAREQHAQSVRAHVTRSVPTGRCDKLYVVTSPKSDAWEDITWALDRPSKALARLPAALRELVECNLYSAPSIAKAMTALLSRVTANDVVIAARGGGDREWLDHFEDPVVVTALGELAMKCPTYTAIGHAKDTLMLEGIVHGMFDTPGGCIYRLDETLQAASTHNAQPPLEAAPTASAPRHASAPELPHPVVHAVPRFRRAGRLGALWMFGIIVVASVCLRLPVPARPLATSLHAARSFNRRALDAGVSVEQPPPVLQQRSTLAGRTKDLRDSAQAPVARELPARPDLAASPLPTPTITTGRAALTPTTEATVAAALRVLAALITPFDMGRDLAAVHAQCAAIYGMWIGGATARCHLPGGREYGFGFSGGLVQTITLRQVGNSPVPLVSAPALSAMQMLSSSGRGPWVVNATPRQVTVQPRSHQPGL